MPQFTKEDVCYLKHGERQIMARVFKPEGPGPFPGIQRLTVFLQRLLFLPFAQRLQGLE